MARRFRFQEWLIVLLGTVALANGVSHTITAARTGAYNPGLVTGLVVFIPIGAISLLRMKPIMTEVRYLSALLVGLGTQAVVSILALRGGRL